MLIISSKSLEEITIYEASFAFRIAKVGKDTKYFILEINIVKMGYTKDMRICVLNATLLLQLFKT